MSEYRAKATLGTIYPYQVMPPVGNNSVGACLRRAERVTAGVQRMTYDERHDHRHLCACGAHLVTPSVSRLPLGCAWHRQVPGRWGVIWAQAERQWGAE